MTHFSLVLAGRRCCLYQTAPDDAVEAVLLQCADSRELEALAPQAEAIAEAAPGTAFALCAMAVEDWSRELSPWEAPAVYGEEAFGGGAAETLSALLAVRSALHRRLPHAGRVYLGGYSLAGLFTLWAGCSADAFDGLAAVSPSVWFPGWTDFAREHPVRARSVYLSLGDKEERTRHPVTSRVGECIRAQKALLEEQGVRCTLEWNPGGHFKDPAGRTARGFAWLLRQPEG